MLNVPFVSTMRSIWQSTRASALPFPSMRSRSELAATRPREGPSQRPTDPMATTEISTGCSGVLAALQPAEYGIEVGDLVVEIEVDVPVERIVDFLHELVGVQHFAHVDSVLLGDLEGVVSLRLIGEVVGPVVEDAFRGHEEIHGEVLSVGNEGAGPVRSPL